MNSALSLLLQALKLQLQSGNKMWKQNRFQVLDPSSVGEIRRFAQGIAEDLAFDEVVASKVSTVVTELATNLLKHAKDGEIFLTRTEHSLDIISIDKGPGMGNVIECLADGYSTQGTAGNGLGAIKRAAHVFDLYTSPKGSVFYAGFHKKSYEDSKFHTGAINLPYKTETLSGDSWTACEDNGNYKVMLADGLGHGILAHEASSKAVEIFEEYYSQSLPDSMNQLHSALRSTRGAAISLAEIDLKKEILYFCGVGNVSGTLYSNNSTKRCISHSGTVGVQIRKVQTFSYPFEKDFMLIMFSDGVSSHFDFKDYPGLQLKNSFIIAGIIYRDFGRISDDSTVVVIKGEA